MTEGPPPLDRALVQGIAWTSAVRWLAQILSWLSTLVVVHLLRPSDYGLVGMALVFFGIAQMFSEAGIPIAVVQLRWLTERQIAQLGGLALMLAVGLCATTAGLSGAVAWFFAEPAVRWIILALSVTFLTRGAQVLPRALLSRDLAFTRLARIDGIEALVMIAVTLALAVEKLGYWALVGGPVVSSAVSTVLCLTARRHAVLFPRHLGELRDAMRLSRRVLGSQLAWYAYSNSDFTVIGRVLGAAALGTYTMAWTVALIPVDRISALVGRVTPAFFSVVQTDPAALRRYFGGLSRALSLCTLPACVGLALVARDFVPVVLGARWSGVVSPLRILAAYAALRSLIVLAPQILVARGRERASMNLSILCALILPVVFYAGSRWGLGRGAGTTGVALGWVTVYPAIAVAGFLRLALRSIGMSWREYGRALWPATSATAVMAIAVLGAHAVAGHAAARSRLLIEIGMGALVYVGILLGFHGADLRAWVPLLRSRRPSPSPPPPPPPP
ncbi:MAG TPA: lipopolysaccharide biosynthesis protein, partial [bacterium]|nr:lipopolysaccharide biosynthesis protein [bacterium]